MAVIGINYTGGNERDDEDNLIEKPIIYESVRLHYMGVDKELIFNSGDFVKDWFDAMKDLFTREDGGDPYLSHSSSVNHFIMDGAKYDSAYLHMDGDKAVLKYVDHSDPNYLWTQVDIYEKGSEFFVAEGTQPTWEELKKLCGHVPITT